MTEYRKQALDAGARLVLGKDAKYCPAAEDILERMLEGNLRYRRQERNHAELSEMLRITTTEEGQHPYAAVVCCADSRVPPEHIFHAGIGELFVIRNAGNVITPAALGSLEYAAAHLHTPLILVMGHRGCGAVASALVHFQKAANDEEAALNELIARVAQGIGTVHTPAEAERNNLKAGLAALGKSPLLCRLLAEGRVGVAGAIYDIRSGAVTLL
jgi:carbonic anhydrase